MKTLGIHNTCNMTTILAATSYNKKHENIEYFQLQWTTMIIKTTTIDFYNQIPWNPVL